MLLSRNILKQLLKFSLSILIFPYSTLTSLQASTIELGASDADSFVRKGKRMHRREDHTMDKLTQELADLKLSVPSKKRTRQEPDGTLEGLLQGFSRYAKYSKIMEIPENDSTQDPAHPENFVVLNDLNNECVEETTLESRTFSEVDTDHPHSFSSTSASSSISCSATSSEYCMNPSLHPQYCTKPFAPYESTLPPTISLFDMDMPSAQQIPQQLSKDIELTNPKNEESIETKIRHLQRKYRLSEDKQSKAKTLIKIKRLKTEANSAATPSIIPHVQTEMPQSMQGQQESTKLPLKEILNMWDQGDALSIDLARHLLVNLMTKDNALSFLEQKRIIRRFKESTFISDQTYAKSWAQKYLVAQNTKTVHFNDAPQYREIPSRYEEPQPIKPHKDSTLFDEAPLISEEESSSFFKALKSIAHGAAAVLTMIR